MEKQAAILCPSSRCKEGVLVLGIVLADKTIAYADRRLRVDSDMARQMQATEISPEKRFRFAGSCVQTSCRQWSNNQCGVIEEAITGIGDQAPSIDLPACSIRPQCRWFDQRGPEACHVCPYIVTDTTLASHPGVPTP